MWSDAGCTYASLQYQHARAVALSAGPYIRVAPGEYIYLTLGYDTTDAQVTEHIDQNPKSKKCRRKRATTRH